MNKSAFVVRPRLALVIVVGALSGAGPSAQTPDAARDRTAGRAAATVTLE